MRTHIHQIWKDLAHLGASWHCFLKVTVSLIKYNEPRLHFTATEVFHSKQTGAYAIRMKERDL